MIGRGGSVSWMERQSVQRYPGCHLQGPKRAGWDRARAVSLPDWRPGWGGGRCADVARGVLGTRLRPIPDDSVCDAKLFVSCVEGVGEDADLCCRILGEDGARMEVVSLSMGEERAVMGFSPFILHDLKWNEESPAGGGEGAAPGSTVL